MSDEIDFDNATLAAGMPPVPSIETSRVLNFISMASFIDDGDWINRHVVSKGKGTRGKIGELWGCATGYHETTTMYGGKELQSIALEGEFEARSFLTGEIMQAPVAYLPKKWASMARAALEGAVSVEMLLTLGVRATGKPIPYEWLVYTHFPARSDRMKDLRALASSDRAKNQIALPAFETVSN